MEINISKATGKDIKSLTFLFDEFDKYNAQEQNQKYVIDINNSSYSEYDLLNSKREIYLAYVDNKVAGYITFFTIDVTNEVFIEDLFILSEFRSLGLGKKLMEIPLNLAKKIKANIKLEVYQWNKKAINFYTELGFEEDSIVFMKKFD